MFVDYKTRGCSWFWLSTNYYLGSSPGMERQNYRWKGCALEAFPQEHLALHHDPQRMHYHPLHSAGDGESGAQKGVLTYLPLSGRNQPKSCPPCSPPRHLPVSCPQSCAPRPAPGTHGHHWFAVHGPGYAGRCPPGGLGGCLHHCQPLWRGATQGYIA